MFNDLVTIGEDIEDYIPTVPTRNYYTFAGWNPKAEGKVIEDKVYTATYTPVNDTNNDDIADEEQRRIIFKNYDGTELLNELVTLGEKTPTPKTNPTRNEYYEFAGWNPSVAATVTADATYTAKYKALEDKNNDNIADQEQTLWEVRFYGFGGATQIGEVQYVVDGEAAVAPTAPAVSGYRFDGWLQDFSNVTSNLNVIANYTDIEAPYINPNVILYNYDSDAEGYLNANITTTVTDNSGVVVEVRYIKGEATATDYESATVMTATEDGTYQINGINENTVYTILAKDAAGNISAVPVEVEGITYKESSGTFEDLYATGTFGGVTGNFLIGPYYRKIDVTTKSNVKIVDARYVVTSGWDSYKKVSDFADPNYGKKLEHTDTNLSSNIQTGVLNKLTVYIKYEKTVEVAPNVYETHTEEKVYTAFMSMIWG